MCLSATIFTLEEQNNGEITLSRGGVPLFLPLLAGTFFTQWHEILSQNTRDFKLSYGEN